MWSGVNGFAHVMRLLSCLNSLTLNTTPLVGSCIAPSCAPILGMSSAARSGKASKKEECANANAAKVQPVQSQRRFHAVPQRTSVLQNFKQACAGKTLHREFLHGSRASVKHLKLIYKLWEYRLNKATKHTWKMRNSDVSQVPPAKRAALWAASWRSPTPSWKDPTSRIFQTCFMTTKPKIG